jgi:hypothetical protein
MSKHAQTLAHYKRLYESNQYSLRVVMGELTEAREENEKLKEELENARKLSRAWGKLARHYRASFNSHIGSAFRLAIEHDGIKAENNRLRAALEAVEWIEVDLWRLCCPWCGSDKSKAHKPDCQRQLALKEGD